MNRTTLGAVRAILPTVLKIVASLVALGGVVWVIRAAPVPVVDYMLKLDIEKQAELWKRRVTLHMTDSEQSFISGTLTESDLEFLPLIPEASDVYRFKLFQSDGTVYWSTRPDDIGSVNTKDYFVTLVASGEIFYKHEVKPASEIDGLVLHVEQTDHLGDREVAEIYVPVLKNGRFLGAIEFYTDITDSRNAFIQRVRGVMAVVSAIVIVVLGVVILMVHRSGQNVMRQLKVRSSKDREMMDMQLRLAKEIRLLSDLNEWLQSSRSLDELFDMVSQFMSYLLPLSEGAIYVYSNSRDVLDGCVSWNGGKHKEHIHPDGCWGLRRGRTYEYGQGEIDFLCEHAEADDDRPYFCFPILAHGETVGLMHLKCKSNADPEKFRDSKKLAQMSAEQISMAISNVRMRDQLQEQSVRDPLTGLYNRRHLTNSLRKILKSSEKKNETVAVVSLDVDHFKKFNDNHGHDAGDLVLRSVGTALKDCCDGDELACRMGGEEFMLIWPGTTRKETETRTEKLRQAIEAISIRYGEKTLPTVTMSQGIAFAPDHGSMVQDLIRTSDDALYAAKARGRNCVVVAGDQQGAKVPKPKARPKSKDKPFTPQAPETPDGASRFAAE